MRYILIFLALSACTTANGFRSYLPSEQHELVSSSLEYVGMHEYRNSRELRLMMGIDPRQTEWCAAFVNSILEQNDYLTSESIHDHPLLARSFTEYGEEVTGEPQQGDIVVLSRGEPWQGHVGFYVNTLKRGNQTYYVLISGNDGDMVTVNAFNTNRVVTVRRVE